MKKLRIVSVVLLLAFLAGCGDAPNAAKGNEASDDESSALVNVIDDIDDSSNAESGESEESSTIQESGTGSGSQVSSSSQETIKETNATVHNNTGAAFDKVYFVLGDVYTLMAVNVQAGAKAPAYFQAYNGQRFENANYYNSPYFVLVVDGKEIPVKTAWEVTDNFDNELMCFFDTIAFFNEDGNYFFSPQPDYINIRNTASPDKTNKKFAYIPQTMCWLEQKGEQKLYAVALDRDRVYDYFPNYKGEIPQYGCTALVSIETIYFEDVTLKYDINNAQELFEERISDKVVEHTVNDVVFVSVDHVRYPSMYYRYKDTNGNVFRQCLFDSHKEFNRANSYEFTNDEQYYKLHTVD